MKNSQALGILFGLASIAAQIDHQTIPAVVFFALGFLVIVFEMADR